MVWCSIPFGLSHYTMDRLEMEVPVVDVYKKLINGRGAEVAPLICAVMGVSLGVSALL